MAVCSAPALGCAHKHEHLLLLLPLAAPGSPLAREPRWQQAWARHGRATLHDSKAALLAREQRVGCSRSRAPAGGFGEGAQEREAWSGGKREGGNL